MLYGSDITSPTVGGSNGSSDSNTPGATLTLRDAGLALELGTGHERAPPPPALKLDNIDAGHSTVGRVGPATVAEVDYEESALRAGIEGLWKLWKVGRRGRATTKLAHEDDTDVFLRVVKDVVGAMNV